MTETETVEGRSSSFAEVGVVQLLDQDDRPCFVVDLDSPVELPPIYYNPPLSKNKGLQSRLHGLPSLYGIKAAQKNNPDWQFLNWQRSDVSGHAATFRYGHINWVAIKISARWRLIAGVLSAVTLETSDLSSSSKPRLSQSTSEPKEYSAEKLTGAITLHKSVHNAMLDVQTYNPNRPPSALTPNSTNSTQAVHATSLRTRPEGVWKNDRFTSRPWTSQHKLLASYDWTVPGSQVEVPPFVEWFRNFDWSSTKIGPIETWPSALRRSVLELMLDPRPSAMYYGHDRIMMYNDYYKEVVGSKHPFMTGKPFGEAWAELGAAFEPAFQRAQEGLATRLDDACFFIERSTFLEECFFSIAVYPMITDEYDQLIIYNPVFETTGQVRAERRTAFLLDLGNSIGTSQDRKEFWAQLLAAFDRALLEIPVAAIYSAEDEHNDTVSGQANEITLPEIWTFEGSTGFPQDFRHKSPLITVEAKSQIPNFDEHIKSVTPVLLQRSDDTLSDSAIKGVTTRSHGDRVTSAVLIPIISNQTVLGFVFLGLDPRRPYDHEHHKFTQLLMAQLTANMASVVLIEDEVRRSRAAAEVAALDRMALSEKLALRTFEAQESEHRFRKMADMAPVAMFHFASDGMPIYCNDLWYDMTKHPRHAVYPMSWYNVIHEEDHGLMDVEWQKLLEGNSVHFELRLKMPFSCAETIGGERIAGSTWIIASAYPEKSEDGTVIGVLGCLTDISRVKWAEDYQTRRKNEALETKRQQENFIDMTSHEMRNPLSAILQCADWIGTSLQEYDIVGKNVTIPAEFVNSHLEAAQTIVMCAQHQKRIIDDVLTLSKLDSNLLIVTPVDVQPAIMIERSLKMFDSELQKADVSLKYQVEDSYKDLKIDWVKLDPSRVLQVILNLVTNAVKFTATQSRRMINLSISASYDVPPVTEGVEWLPRSSNRPDLTEEIGDWGSGEVIYLEVRVQDTGKGLDEYERKLLFQRFSQASPRTHVVYGGSGLGLFISRELTELQGGQIGVKSEAGVGSTFAFYVKARRTTPEDTPEVANDHFAIIDPSAVAELAAANSDATATTIFKKKVTAPKISEASRHVLVVEDNLVNQRVLSKQLKSAGCIVTVANHGQEALAFLSKSVFSKGKEQGQELSIILMDLEMPVMDGLTCVREIRRLEDTGELRNHVPVIAVTANARSEQIRVAKEAGMDGVVTKPFKIPELIPEMERLVEATKAANGIA